jgi:hypothetical protein
MIEDNDTFVERPGDTTTGQSGDAIMEQIGKRGKKNRYGGMSYRDWVSAFAISEVDSRIRQMNSGTEKSNYNYIYMACRQSTTKEAWDGCPQRMKK